MVAGIGLGDECTHAAGKDEQSQQQQQQQQHIMLDFSSSAATALTKAAAATTAAAATEADAVAAEGGLARDYTHSKSAAAVAAANSCSTNSSSSAYQPEHLRISISMRMHVKRKRLCLLCLTMLAMLTVYMLASAAGSLVGQLSSHPLVAGLPGYCGDEWPAPTHVDPEVFQTIDQVIADKGFKVSSHSAVTEDGYILGLQRILPLGHSGRRRRAQPVLLMHGLLDSSFTWVSNLANQSLGYRLSRAGYDVWLGNARGNTYSRRHKTLSPSHYQFWQFSWDHMAKYDLPAIIHAVLNETGADQLYYVGHSQGTEIALAAWSEQPELGQKVRAAALLAPVATVGHIESPIRLVTPLATTLADALDLFGHGEFLPTTRLLKFLSLAVCGDALSPLCSNFIFLMCGFDCRFTNVTRLPVYISHTPAGTSAMNMVHYAQGVQHKRFQKYDYGPANNQRQYGQPTPPLYDLHKVQVPLALYHGKKDWLADPTDFAQLAANVTHVTRRLRTYDEYNHLDFVWAYNAVDEVYNDVVDFFQQNR